MFAQGKISEESLPLQLQISFEKLFQVYEKYAHNSFKNHPLHTFAKQLKQEITKHPELIEGFTDVTLIKKLKDSINVLLAPLFPEALQLNEIKAASIPFSFTTFKFSDRFQNIVKNAGDDFELTVRNFENDGMYIMACTFILGAVYGYKIDMKRPFYFDIPDETTGTMKYYRAAFNADFSEIIPTEKAPKLTEEDFKTLLKNYHDISIWKEKFPPNSYIFKGFGLINLFDVTAEESISSMKANLLSGKEGIIFNLQSNFRDFYGLKDLLLGFSIFDKKNDKICETVVKTSNSLLLKNKEEIKCNSNYFCKGIMEKVFQMHETFIISDVEAYGDQTNRNLFYQNLQQLGIGSIILIPIPATKKGDLALLEIASPRAYDLNSVNINKLKDIIPVFETAVKRMSEERQNMLEATIQENYTAIHPAVKWRFYDAAEKFFVDSQNNENAKLDEIIFEDVYPLFGQSDIKGSSEARNIAIKKDLTKQLKVAIEVLKNALDFEKLPIYEELMFRVSSYLNEVESGLKAGDEISILDFLKKDIYPVFNHLELFNEQLTTKVQQYKQLLNPELGVIYDQRKAYEDSVNLLNNRLAKFLDSKQKEAQQMYPHYFERYKTDGVEFNMYIGKSINKDASFNEIYLYNLRLWQLQTMVEMENIAFEERKKMTHDLRVASLILVHSNPMSIKFRMDEKQFDVDGAYNIRYEIIKKRIDKVNIKGTLERLTTPGKIAIVYTQEKDALEYVKYIHYLQSKKQLGNIEYLELDDLQGVAGLKALRVEVLYQKDFNEKKTITFNDLMKEIAN
ncbi:GAF domain-containing protein [Polaribacter sp.]|uniref:GAF domain-containing protein n=1 Tax=Polaribacter sp. TaxID=1920175 RepID=UPI0040486F5F